MCASEAVVLIAVLINKREDVMLRKGTTFLGTVSIILLLCSQAFSQTTGEKISVKVAPAKKGRITQELSLTANISPDKQVTVIPKIGGTLKEINVELGDAVKKGEVIAKIDDEEISLGVKQAEVSLISAKANYEKAKSIAEIKAEGDLRRAEAAFNSAQAGLDLAKSTAEVEFFTNLERAQAGLKTAQAQFDKIKKGARKEDLERAEAGYQQALANFQNSKRDLERAEEDYSRGAIPEQQFDKVKLGFKVAQAQLTSAEASLKLIKKGAQEEDIRMTEAQLQQAESQVEYLEKLKEAKSWESKIKATEAQWENARVNLDLAKKSWESKNWEKDLELVQAQIQQAETALKLAKIRLGDCTIKAPISGVINKRFADEGALVGPTQPLVSIVSIDTVKVVLHILDKELDKVKLTKKVILSMDNYLREVVVPQEINVSPTVDPRSRKIEVQIKVPNPKRRIKPGMFPNVKLILEQAENVILIPKEALIRKEDGDYIFVVREGKAHLCKVDKGLENGKMVEIIKGIKEKDLVIITEQRKLKEGDLVTIK